MEDTDESVQNDARDEILSHFFKDNPIEDPAIREIVSKAVTKALEITGRNFQQIMNQVVNQTISLPPDVDPNNGLFTAWFFTVADSPEHGRVVGVKGSHGTTVTEDIFQQHFQAMKHMVNEHVAVKHPTKH